MSSEGWAIFGANGMASDQSHETASPEGSFWNAWPMGWGMGVGDGIMTLHLSLATLGISPPLPDLSGPWHKSGTGGGGEGYEKSERVKLTCVPTCPGHLGRLSFLLCHRGGPEPSSFKKACGVHEDHRGREGDNGPAVPRRETGCERRRRGSQPVSQAPRAPCACDADHHRPVH